MEKQKKNFFSNHKKMTKIALILYIVIAVAITGTSFAWFIANNKVEVAPPDDISITADSRVEMSVDGNVWGSSLQITPNITQYADVSGDGIHFWFPKYLNDNDEVDLSNKDAFESVNTATPEKSDQDAENSITYYLKQLASGDYELTLIVIPVGFASNRVELLSVYNEKNIVSLSASAWNGLSNQGIKTVVLPAHLRFFNNKDAVADIESYEISADNPAFSTLDGVLYSKDRSILIAYPQCKLGDSFVLPDAVTMISSQAFSGTVNLGTLTINHKVIVCDSAFYACEKLQNVVFTATDPSLFIGKQTFASCVLENSITVWIPTGMTAAYQNAVIEDVDLPAKFTEGTP